MNFIVKNLTDDDWFVEGCYEIHEDSSILFSSNGGGFQLLLGEGYHYVLDVDKKTGRCYGFYTLFDAIKNDLQLDNIQMSESKKAKLFFIYDGINAVDGCHYIPFSSQCYWDDINKILCIGDKEIDGEIIEFASDTFAKVRNNQLSAIYIKLNFI